MNNELEEMAKRLSSIFNNVKWWTYEESIYKGDWRKLAREVKIIEIEARLTEHINYCHLCDTMNASLCNRNKELQSQLNTLEGEL